MSKRQKSLFAADFSAASKSKKLLFASISFGQKSTNFLSKFVSKSKICSRNSRISTFDCRYNLLKPTRKSSNRTGALTKRAAGGVIAAQGCLTNGLLRANRNFSRLRRRAAVTPHNAFSLFQCVRERMLRIGWHRGICLFAPSLYARGFYVADRAYVKYYLQRCVKMGIIRWRAATVSKIDQI